jgi:TrmH family RNA methyltransferase
MVMSEIDVASLHNPQIKNVVKLRERRQRDRQGLMLIEGARELTLAVEHNIKLQSLLYCDKFFSNRIELAIIKGVQERGVKLYRVDKRVFEKIAYREHPDGLLAVAYQPNISLKNLILGNSPLVVVAVEIEKPGNLGAILRSADAAGADAVIVCDQCTDLFNPNVVRASMGTLFTVKVAAGSSQDTIQRLKEKGVVLVAATPGTTTEYTDIDFRTPVAIVLGSEQFGLPEIWKKSVDKAVHIPMYGKADSLNVSAAATVLLYEAVRQRHSS